MCFVTSCDLPGAERTKHFRARRGTKAGRRIIRRNNTVCVKQFKSSKQQLGVNLDNFVLISHSLPSETNTVKLYNVLPIPSQVKHGEAKKIKILIGQTFSNLQSVKIIDNIQPISQVISTNLCIYHHEAEII